MENKANYVAVGAFVLAAVTALVLAVLWFAQFQLHQEYRHYLTRINGSVTGLAPESLVRLNGVDVGHVTDIALDPDNPRIVLVRFDVRSEIVLHEDSMVTIESTGLTGQPYLFIDGGTPGTRRLTPQAGQDFAEMRWRPSSLEQLENSAPEIANQAELVARRVAQLLDQPNQRAIAETLANIRDTTAALARHTAEIDQIMVNSARATKDLAVTLEALDQTTAQLHAMLAEAHDLPKHLDDTLVTADATVKRLGALADDVDATVKENRPHIREFSTVGLGQVSQLATQMRGLVDTLTHLSQQLERDPNRLVFGERRQGYAPP